VSYLGYNNNSGYVREDFIKISHSVGHLNRDWYGGCVPFWILHSDPKLEQLLWDQAPLQEYVRLAVARVLWARQIVDSNYVRAVI
jgi:hypothetical protein